VTAAEPEGGQRRAVGKASAVIAAAMGAPLPAAGYDVYFNNNFWRE